MSRPYVSTTELCRISTHLASLPSLMALKFCRCSRSSLRVISWSPSPPILPGESRFITATLASLFLLPGYVSYTRRYGTCIWGGFLFFFFFFKITKLTSFWNFFFSSGHYIFAAVSPLMHAAPIQSFWLLCSITVCKGHCEFSSVFLLVGYRPAPLPKHYRKVPPPPLRIVLH